MNHQIYPCLWFDGKAREAAELYCSVFKNSKITTDNGMVVLWELEGKKFMGLNGGPQYKMSPALSIFVYLPTIEEVNKAWDALIKGGKAMIPIDKQPWSERYGWLQDKYGCTWQISVGEKKSIRPSFLFVNENFGKAEEAMQLYSSLFSDSATTTMMHYPPGDANAGKVMYAEFSLNGTEFSAMDGPDKHAFNFSEGVSLVISCDTQNEIDHYWNGLIKNGGEESMCGWLKDKFGVSWQVVPSMLGKLMSDPGKGQRAMQALLKMKKLEIAQLENA